MKTVYSEALRYTDNSKKTLKKAGKQAPDLTFYYFILKILEQWNTAKK